MPRSTQRTMRPFVVVACGSMSMLMACGDLPPVDDGAESHLLPALNLQCGPTWDSDPVEKPSKDQLVSPPFIQTHSPAVAHQSSCSGTLISRNLYLTAGHCSVPKTVKFNYQLDPSGQRRKTVSYKVKSVVEHVDTGWGGGLDYAIYYLDGDPGRTITPARIASRNCPTGDVLAAIGHPGGGYKQVTSGHVSRLDDKKIHSDLDVYSGYSGAGLLCASSGLLTGVLAWGTCSNEKDGYTVGNHIEYLLEVSPTLRTLAEGGTVCTPRCSAGSCGQPDGCGGTCSSAEKSACGKCGNGPCKGSGGCQVDKLSNCASLARAGYCKTQPTFMAGMCCKTCKF